MTLEKISRNKLTCTVTGKTVGVAPKVFDARAAVYGDVETLRKNYISAEARKLLCAGKTVAEIRAANNVSADVPLPADSFVLKYTKWAKYRKPKTTVNEVTQTIVNEVTQTTVNEVEISQEAHGTTETV